MPFALGVHAAVGVIGGAQLVAEGVLQDRAALLAVESSGVFQDDVELSPVDRSKAVGTGRRLDRVLLLRQIGRPVQGVVVLEQEDRNLSRGDRLLLDDDRGGVQVPVGIVGVGQHGHRGASHRIAGERQHRDVVSTRSDEVDVGGAARRRARLGLARARVRGDGMVAGVEAKRQHVLARRRVVRIDRVGRVFLDDVLEAADRVTVRVDDVDVEVGGLGAECGGRPEDDHGIPGEARQMPLSSVQQHCRFLLLFHV